MNLLAHGYLSGRHEGLLIGNFMGDFVKGDPAKPRHGLSLDQVAGVRLHRAIDSFTDSHADVAAVRDILHPRCHKYAGVAVDVFFDHFLAIQFEQLTGESLSDFTTYFYQTVRRNSVSLPPEALQMFNAMVRYDWLTQYQTTEGIDRSLKGIARRTAFPSGLETAIIDFEQHYTFIAQSFATFWVELSEHIEEVRNDLLLTF